jgi:hypothetical protein
MLEGADFSASRHALEQLIAPTLPPAGLNTLGLQAG